MSDRPPLPTPSGDGALPDPERSPTTGPGHVRDAVFEDIELPISEDIVTSEVAVDPPAAAPEPAPLHVFPAGPDELGPPPVAPGPSAPERAEAAPPPVREVHDPFASLPPDNGPATAADRPPELPPRFQKPALEYSPEEGFRIDFDEKPDAQTTAVGPVRRGVPATQTGGRGGAPPPIVVAPGASRAEARRAARDKARMLRRYRWLILATTLLGLGIGALVSALAGETYTAHSVLLVEGDRAVAGAYGQAPGEPRSQVLNQAIVLQQAPEIAREAAAAILSRPDAPAFSTVRAAAGALGEPLTAEAYGEYLQSEVVTVEPAGEEVDAIRVEASAGSADEAALIARLYTAQYIDLTRLSNRERVTETREILEGQIARRQGELDEIESQLQGYMTAQNAAGLEAQTSATVGQIGQLQSQLDNARVQAQTRQAELAQLQADLASVPQRLDAGATAPTPVETTQLDAEIARIETLLEQAYAQNPQYRGNPAAHPDLRRFSLQLQSLRDERQRLRNARTDAAVAAGGLDAQASGSNGPAYVADLQRQIAQTRAALEGNRAQAAALAGRLAEARGALRAVPGREVRLAQLQRQRAATAATLGQLRTEYDGARLAEATELGFAQVIRDVQVPREPVSPNVPLNLLLGGLLGLLSGLAIGFVRYQTDSHARTPDDLTEHGFTVVGTVPDMTRALRGERHAVGGLLVDPGLVTVTRPFAPESEAFRHLHAALSVADGATPGVVLISGPDVGVGKSVTAANLATAAAQSGRRVLLVDADLRRPTVQAFLGLGPQPPLGEGPEDTNLVYWSTPVPGLFAMTPQSPAEAPDQMWAPHQIGAIIEHLRGAFDLVLIDTPSALRSAGATLLAPHADAALLVAEADRTDLDALSQVASEFVSVGLGRIGVVLNRFDARKAVGFRSTAGVRHAS